MSLEVRLDEAVSVVCRVFFDDTVAFSFEYSKVSETEKKNTEMRIFCTYFNNLKSLFLFSLM